MAGARTRVQNHLVRQVVAIPLVANSTDRLRRRRHAMRAQLRALGIGWLSIQVPQPSVEEMRSDDVPLMKARLGRASTLLALDECTRQEEKRFCLILEDDARLHPRFFEELLRTVRTLPPGFQALHLCPEFTWGGTQPDPTHFQLHASCTRPSTAERYFTSWPATLGQWVGGPVAFIVRRSHAQTMAHTLRGAGMQWIRVIMEPEFIATSTRDDSECIGPLPSRGRCHDANLTVSCCEPEAIDVALAIHHHPDEFVARQPPLCFEDPMGGTSFEPSRFAS